VGDHPKSKRTAQKKPACHAKRIASSTLQPAAAAAAPSLPPQATHTIRTQQGLCCAFHAGRRGVEVEDGVLDALASCFDDICSLVDGFVKQGERAHASYHARLA
jgi:hypothetical protein